MNSFSHSCLILDACSAINLMASGRFEDILQSIPCPVAIPEFVKTYEVQWIYDGPITDIKSKKKVIDLSPLINSGSLLLVDCDNDQEALDLVEFAVYIDDGEATVAAIAVNRGWTVVTDDKKAIRGLKQNRPNLRLITTFDVLEQWVENRQPTASEIVDVVTNISLKGRHQPELNHSLRKYLKP